MRALLVVVGLGLFSCSAPCPAGSCTTDSGAGGGGGTATGGGIATGGGAATGGGGTATGGGAATDGGSALDGGTDAGSCVVGSVMSATDTFRVPAQASADVLLVLSSGPGMGPAQQALAANSQSFFQYATATAVNFRLGVLLGGADGGSLLAPVLTPTTPSLAQQFSTLVTPGTGGAPTTSCLTRATESLRANSTWLRADASLGIICLQDSLEQLTPPSTAAAVGVLGSLRSAPVTVNAIAQFAPCALPADARLAEAADLSFGATASVCDLATIGDVVKRAFGEREAYVLTRRAQVDAGVIVQIDNVAVPPVATGATVWSAEERRNAVIFAPLYVPQPGATVTVQYTAVCVP